MATESMITRAKVMEQCLKRHGSTSVWVEWEDVGFIVPGCTPGETYDLVAAVGVPALPAHSQERYLSWLAESLQHYAKQGIILGWSLNDWSIDQVTAAFLQKPRGENMILDVNEHNVVAYLKVA